MLFGYLIAVLVGNFTGFRPAGLLTGTVTWTEAEANGDTDSDRDEEQDGKNRDGDTRKENTATGVTLDDIDCASETYTRILSLYRNSRWRIWSRMPGMQITFSQRMVVRTI